MVGPPQEPRGDGEGITKGKSIGEDVKHPIPKRERAKIRRRLKNRFGLTRRDIGAIGAGHMNPPDGYRTALVAAIDRAMR